MLPPSDSVVLLSRIQFAFTAMFHFLFVPLTLGLTWVVFIMEAAYVRSGKVIYRDMTKFWAKLLAINFAMGVVTGVTMEFEFGTNWAYFSRMIGGSFAPILAIEGITAFMLEATMFGLFFFTWNKISKAAHLTVTFFMALGASLSIVNIIAANSWMQHPTPGSTFDFASMTMNINSIVGLYVSQLAQIRVAHVANAGYVTGSMFVLGISAYYLLKNRDVEFAKRSMGIGAAFGFCCVIAAAFYGDANGLIVSKLEPEKMAAIEAQWYTQKPPAAWTVVALPDQEEETNHYALTIPYALSIIADHSLKGTVTGMQQIMDGYRPRVVSGMVAYNALQNIRKGIDVEKNTTIFNQHRDDLGFGFIAKHVAPDATVATPDIVDKAVKKAIPNVAISFWAFRLMIGFWGIMMIVFISALVISLRGKHNHYRFFLWIALFAIPLPFLAAECGWVLAENGRQPWVIHYVLPTFMGASSVDIGTISGSLFSFIGFYITLFILEITLMTKYARKGPSCLGTNRYHYETQQT